MKIEICVGSSCYLKGAPDIVRMMEEELKRNRLSDSVGLSGSFCTGRCNRRGVTVTVDGAVHTDITRENFRDFFASQVLQAALRERQDAHGKGTDS